MGKKKILVPTQSEEDSDPIEQVDVNLAGVELTALACLLRCWATPEVVAKRGNDWKAKLPAFRRAVGAGVQSGGKHTVPLELVLDEYSVVYRIAEWLSKQEWPERSEEALSLALKQLRVPREVAGGIERPIPSPICFARPLKRKDAITKLQRKTRPWKLDPRVSTLSLTRGIVGVRLGYTDERVADVIRQEQELKRNDQSISRALSSDRQCVLASVFLDICSLSTQPQRLSLLHLIMDTLLHSRYDAKKAYYLAQKGHCLRRSVVMAPHNPREVKEFCEQVRADPKPQQARL
jgi:hypothetical protein